MKGTLKLSKALYSLKSLLRDLFERLSGDTSYNTEKRSI